jgi:hypothetical protein
LKLITHILLVE